MLSAKRSLIGAGVVAAGLCASFGPAPSAEPALPPEVKWVWNWSDGVAEAKRTGKPLYVVFRCER